MGTTADLELGRAAFDGRAWVQARDRLSSADRGGALEPEDLERLATAQFLTGRAHDSTASWARAFHGWTACGPGERAARCGFWLAFTLSCIGESARSAGWAARARRLLGPDRPECAERGYLMLLDAIRRVHAGDLAGALELAGEAVELGERCGEPDLATFARCVTGRVLIRQGRRDEGIGLLDEVMVTLLGDEVSPALAGDLYCTVIEGCQEVHDLRRACDWTVALTHWCEAQPGLVPYRGQCQVHRTEIMMRRGAWDDADVAAVDARATLCAPPRHPAAGAAEYLCAELHRLRGRYADAEEAYRRAGRWGREPQPGLARLRLAQGDVAVAAAGVGRALEEATDPIVRPELLAAAVDVLLAVGDVPAAAARATELSDLAAQLDAAVLNALATAGTGAVRAAEGDPAGGLALLRTAWALWHDLDAPYEAARVRVEIGRACRALGDEEAARMELDAAAEVFAQLGAVPDLARTRDLAGHPAGADRGGAAGLTARELEVLRLVARGLSNRAIAAELVLSDKTVARHMSNILTKVGVHSRSAAAAWAHDQRLL